MKLSLAQVQQLKRECADKGAPIAYVSEPTPTSARVVFADGHVSLTLQDVRDHAAQVALTT